jgi:hypothetical protein
LIAELHIGYGKSTHELALAGNFEALKQYLIGIGRDAQVASREAREVLDFYELGTDCLWITFARDHLWWTFASPEVTWLGGDGQLAGERHRESIGGWRNTDVNGVALRTNTLSTKLTKVAGYRRTICKVEAEEYLLRRINGVKEPFAEKSAIAREALIRRFGRRCWAPSPNGLRDIGRHDVRSQRLAQGIGRRGYPKARRSGIRTAHHG